MTVQENISLLPFNTFGINAHARYFASCRDTEEIKEALSWFSGQKHASSHSGILVLGGGSNVLLTKDFDGLVIKNEIKGITELHEDNDYVYIRAGAGENWHEFVQYCIQRNWAGLENLSLIPGNVGASPMQNIGAYGVELADVFWDLEALHLREQHLQTFTTTDCRFGYRDSVFKNRFRDQYVILQVTVRLRKVPRYNTSYGAVEKELEKMGVSELSIAAVSRAVMNIRRSKLPDPAVMANAGSFFKNPELPDAKWEALQQQYPGIIAYPLLNGNVKLAAGWLIEQCGWKGYREGEVGCHASQALVLVNYGKATGEQILALSEKIVQSVWKKFGVKLEREVNII
jgi:UDP-N-acetylmuramate dehydrogenase